MGWHLLETLLQQIGEQSTLVGKLWGTATFVFRFIIVASVGDAVYSDEQSDFTCNTGQPGCENVCFNQFSPISHLRFWAAQIIAVCTPSVVYIVYVMHMQQKESQDHSGRDFEEEGDRWANEEESFHPEPQGSPKKRKVGRVPSAVSRRSRPERRRERLGIVRDSANVPEECTAAIDVIMEEDDIENDQFEEEENFEDDACTSSKFNQELATLKKKKKEKRTKRNIQIFYVIALFLRTGFEGIFIWLQYELYGFAVPELFQCERAPCPNIVDCFVSRPMEKTIFLWFMFIVSALCLALNIVEIKYLGLKRLYKLLCVNDDAVLSEDDNYEKEDEKYDNLEDDSKTSKRSYFRMDDRSNPTAPPYTEGGDLYNVVDYSKRKEDDDEDCIGFDAIGDQPPYATPGYPYVHRYGVILNVPPPPGEPEKSYL